MTEAPNTQNIINEADKARIAGKYQEARNKVKFLLDISSRPLDDFNQRSHDMQQEFMQAARIFVSSTISLARSSQEAPEVAKYLGEAKEYIDGIYNNRHVESVAKQEGFRDDLFSEMERDKVSYLKTYGALTGQDITEEAIERLQTIIENSTNSSIRTLAAFERAQLIHKRNNTQESFEDITTAFEALVAVSSNSERVATITARYIIAAENETPRNEVAIRRGEEVYKAIHHTDETRNILEREKKKASEEKERHATWRATAKGDYDSLAL